MKEFLISNLLSNLTHDGAYSPRNFTDKGKIVANIKIQTNFNLVSLAQIKCLIAFSMQVPADWGGGGGGGGGCATHQRLEYRIKMGMSSAPVGIS